MDWNYFRKEPVGFSLKRLPAVNKPIKIKDVTELSEWRVDFRGVSFEEGCRLYQHTFDTRGLYEIEIDTFDEAADRAPVSLLMGMAPFKGHMAELDSLIETTEPIVLALPEAALKKAISTGLVAGDEDSGYLAGPKLSDELMGLVQRMVSGAQEAIRDFPKVYQEMAWSELVEWYGLPPQLSRMAVGAYGGPIGQRLAQETQHREDNHVPGSDYGPPHFDPPLELHFHYQGSRDSYPKHRRVAIHHIIGVHQVYMKGRCLDRDEERSFLGHHIHGEILNTQTGELIPVANDTTSCQLREVLRAQWNTSDPSGVASKSKQVEPKGSAFSITPAHDSSMSPREKLISPWYRRYGIWLIPAFFFLLWGMFR